MGFPCSSSDSWTNQVNRRVAMSWRSIRWGRVSVRSCSLRLGSSARQTQATRDKPCDAVIMAIVDQWDLDGETVYVK